MSLDQIEFNVKKQMEECGEALYVLGPLVTDIAPGYDHHLGYWGGHGRLAWHSDALLCDPETSRSAQC